MALTGVRLLHACISAFLSCSLARSSVQSARPNIILFHCDEMDGRVLDPRHPLSNVARLPHLAAMAASGVNFVNTYCNSPLCAPSRASMFTGRRASSIEAWNNMKALAADITERPPQRADPNCAKVVGYGEQVCLEMGRRQNVSTTINHAMAAQGYTVSLHGKMDTGGGPTMLPNGTSSSGFHDTGTWPSNPSDPTHATGASHYFFPGDVLHSWATGANISKPIFGPLSSINHVDDRHANSSEKKDWHTVEQCVHFLDDYQVGEPPFFLYCSVLNPHPPYTSNASWEPSINRLELQKSIELTARTWTPPSTAHPADTYSSLSEALPESFDADLAWRLALAYHGQIAEVDAMLGKVLSALQRSGAASNTYVIFTSDHGEMHMEHRLIEKMSMYEGSARVPLLVTGPGVPCNTTVTEFSTLIDLFPTLLDMAQAPSLPDAGLQGHSLAPFLGLQPRRLLAPRPSHAVVEYMGEHVNTPHFMLRTGDWKYVAYGREPPYQDYRPRLFNLTADPLELEDLAKSAPLAEKVRELDAQLRSIVDYPSIVRRVDAENRAHMRRWMTANADGNRWRELFHSAFSGLEESDLARFQRWLNRTGEFAPSDVALLI